MTQGSREAAPSLGTWFVRGGGFALGVVVVAGLVALGVKAWTVLLLVFISIILAAGLEPFVGWLRSHVKLGRGATILLVYGAFLLGVLGLAFLVLPAAVTQFETTLDRLPPFFDRARIWAADLRPAAFSRSVSSLIEAAADILEPGRETTPSTGQVVRIGLVVAEVVAAVATVLAVVYFWLVEHARIQRYVLAFAPIARRAGVRAAWDRVEMRLGGWVRGQLILMATMGLATTTAYTLLDVPGALLLGLIAAITEAIPLIGPLLGAIPAIIVATTVSPQLALIVAAIYLVLQVLESNILVPIIMRNTIGISPFLVTLSLLTGAAAGGLLGALLGVPIAATIEIVLEGRQAREVPVAQDPTTSPDLEDEPSFAAAQRTRPRPRPKRAIGAAASK